MVTKNGSSLYMAIATVALACAALFLPSHVFAQKMFPNPEAAAEALVDALAKNDPKALRAVLGENWKRFIPTEGVDRGDVDDFLADWQKSHSIEPDTDGRVHLAVGPDKWTLPIPIVKKGDAWGFDVKAGAEEIRTRRIGRNELSAMQAALAYYDAQKDYALSDRNRDGVLEYAQKLLSSPAPTTVSTGPRSRVKRRARSGPCSAPTARRRLPRLLFQNPQGARASMRPAGLTTTGSRGA